MTKFLVHEFLNQENKTIVTGMIIDGVVKIGMVFDVIQIDALYQADKNIKQPVRIKINDIVAYRHHFTELERGVSCALDVEIDSGCLPSHGDMLSSTQ